MTPTLAWTRFVALSDDMTGAAACAGEISRALPQTRVELLSWRAVVEGSRGATAVVVDTASRMESVDEARRRISSVIAALGADNVHGECFWYKRIDSRLRGHIAAEIDVVRRDLQLPAVIVPAAPALGIETVAGTQLRRIGERQDSFGSAARSWLNDCELLRPTDSDAAALSKLLDAGNSVLFDASSVGDLRRIARLLTAVAITQSFFVVGSYGMAAALCEARIIRLNESEGREPRPAPTLVVVGSTEAASCAQADLLESTGIFTVKPWEQFVTVDGRRQVIDKLTAGRDALVRLADQPTMTEPEPARAAAEALKVVLCEANPGAIVLVGGDLASSVAARLGSVSASVIAEPWPTIPILCVSRPGRQSLLVVVKSGGVGRPEWLLHALSMLRALDAARQRGGSVVP
ncbi:MAG TPA: four-carbon acid sugar kinase family protein [Acidimicrobiales bacterium]|nr:four-carbon acid sugar kinase family protein [Acidimicrobiales bacterium]